MAYDRAITVFAPDGHLKQVEYAHEAARQGNAALMVKGINCAVLVAEKKPTSDLEDSRDSQKTYLVDHGIVLTFSGFNADGRKVASSAREECHDHRVRMRHPASVYHIAHAIGAKQQRFTQRGGYRPFGVTILLMGMKLDNPAVYQIEPSGVVTQWKARAIGKSCEVFLNPCQNAAVDARISGKKLQMLTAR